ncbi:MAG: 3-mercaptopyruvate sulfurtransferase [Cucumibacter sp.]
MTKTAPPLVSTEFLARELGAAKMRVVDGSWHMPSSGRNARAEFEARHIPGAVFFDIDAIADTSIPLPHMVAGEARFAAMAGALGIGEADRIVVYDSLGLYSAARVWWNFRIMGAAQVYVLDGGLPRWLAEDRPVESGVPYPAPARFNARLRPGAVIPADGILTALKQPGETQIADVRPAGRFNGEVAEPRPGLRRGHIPGSLNLPFDDLIEDGALREVAELVIRMRAAGIDPEKPVISTCGSGVTAPILNLALAVAGYERMQVYDGSWAEWGANPGLPIA